MSWDYSFILHKANFSMISYYIRIPYNEPDLGKGAEGVIDQTRLE